MKIFPNIKFADAKRERRQGELAFTMVEIAIAIGVIGFALVAIIGILPAGMNVQRDSREDNVVSQDAAYFMDAIRNGIAIPPGNNGNITGLGQGLDFLTNSVVFITGYQYHNNSPLSINWGPFDVATQPLSGAQILGLLSTPQDQPVTNSFSFTRAIVRALSSPASAQGTNSSVTAFMYQMDVEITPLNNFAIDSTNFEAYSLANDSNDYILRSNRWVETTTNVNNSALGSGALTYNLFDLRLRFSWPVINNGTTTNGNGYVVVGEGRQTYRTIIGSQMIRGSASSGPAPLWFFQPLTFTNQSPPNL